MVSQSLDSSTAVKGVEGESGYMHTRFRNHLYSLEYCNWCQSAWLEGTTMIADWGVRSGYITQAKAVSEASTSTDGNSSDSLNPTSPGYAPTLSRPLSISLVSLVLAVLRQPQSYQKITIYHSLPKLCTPYSGQLTSSVHLPGLLRVASLAAGR